MDLLFTFIALYIIYLLFSGNLDTSFFSRRKESSNGRSYRKFRKHSSDNIVKSTEFIPEEHVQVSNVYISDIFDPIAIYYRDGALYVPDEFREEYRTYLKSPEWFELRKCVLKRDNHRCLRCNTIGHLQVHHTSYHGIYENFSFTEDQLESVCELCHNDIHQGILPMKKEN